MIQSDQSFGCLLALANPTLSAAQKDFLNPSLSEIQDWEGVANQAQSHMLASLVYEHLANWPAPQPWLNKAQQALKPHAHQQLRHTLQRAALKKQFIEQHLIPNDIPFAAVKGWPLANRYYPKSHTRPARDVDIWMATEHMPTVVRSAQNHGFKVYPHARALNDTELAIHFKHAEDIALYDHRCILVELDSRLDKSAAVFKLEEVWPRLEEQTIDGLQIKVLPTTDLFIYLCLHHTRHRWSKLIWVADMHALRAAPEFDEAAIRAEALRLGVHETIDAALTFADACQSKDPIEAAQQDPRVAQMMADCIKMFYEGRPAEIEGYQQRLTRDYPYAWQLTGNELREGWFSKQLKKFRPSLNDYQLLPLPLSLYPLYYLLRPGLAIIRRIQRLRSFQQP